MANIINQFYSGGGTPISQDFHYKQYSHYYGNDASSSWREYTFTLVPYSLLFALRVSFTYNVNYFNYQVLINNSIEPSTDNGVMITPDDNDGKNYYWFNKKVTGFYTTIKVRVQNTLGDYNNLSVALDFMYK